MFPRPNFDRNGAFGSRRRGTQNPFIVLLFMRLLQQINSLPVKPPVTLGLIAVQAGLWFGPRFGIQQIPYLEPWEVCLSPNLLLQRKEWHRMILHAFFHASEYHLYYNLSSFLYKGVVMEDKLGSTGFACLVGLITVSNSVLYVLLSSICGLDQCVLGFSGVILALKVILNYDVNDPNGESFFFGIRLPTKFVVWVEIILLHFVSPNSSLLGHICGALTGLAYVTLIRWLPVTRSFFRSMPYAGSNYEPRFSSSGSWGEGSDYRRNRYQQDYDHRSEQGFRETRRPTEASEDELRRRRIKRLSRVGLSSGNR